MSAPKAKEEIARAVVMAGGDIRDTTEVQRLEYEALEWTRAQRITAPPAAPSSAPPSSSTACKEDSVKEATLPTPHNEFEEFAGRLHCVLFG